VTPEFNRIFRMSAFEALRLIRTQQKELPRLGYSEIRAVVARVSAHSVGLDFDAGATLSELMSSEKADFSDLAFYQKCIEVVISTQRPTWLRMIAFGRSKFVEKLTRDEVQCFRTAGLLEEPPTPNVIAWWDRIATQSRQITDAARMEQARRAEALSFKFEQHRLRSLGIDREPRWTAVEDNQAGYDIHSFDRGTSEPVARLIEVKSTIANPPRFFLTKNEWGHAEQFDSVYHFHVWDMRTEIPELHQFTVSQIRPHIPSNNADGRWTDVEIPLESVRPQ